MGGPFFFAGPDGVPLPGTTLHNPLPSVVVSMPAQHAQQGAQQGVQKAAEHHHHQLHHNQQQMQQHPVMALDHPFMLMPVGGGVVAGSFVGGCWCMWTMGLAPAGGHSA